MSPNHLPLSVTLKIMVLSSQTLEFVTKDNIYSFDHNKSFSLVIRSRNSVLVKNIKFQSTGVTLSPLPTMYLCKFGLNPLTGSERFTRVSQK